MNLQIVQLQINIFSRRFAIITRIDYRPHESEDKE